MGNVYFTVLCDFNPQEFTEKLNPIRIRMSAIGVYSFFNIYIFFFLLPVNTATKVTFLVMLPFGLT